MEFRRNVLHPSSWLNSMAKQAERNARRRRGHLWVRRYVKGDGIGARAGLMVVGPERGHLILDRKVMSGNAPARDMRLLSDSFV
jgi:hypothetical protein